MERVRRVELPTLCLASIRSSQLSYTRVVNFLQELDTFVNLGAATRDLTAPASDEKTACDNWRLTK